MTWREKRTVTFLLFILGALSIALVLVLAMKYRQDRTEPDVPAVSAVALAEEESACTALTYYNGTATLDFRRDEGGKWVWTADEDFPLDDSHLTSILETLSAMTPQQTISSYESLDALGLEAPRASVTAAYDSGAVFSLAFGNPTTDGTSCYAMKNGQTETLYIYSAELLPLLEKGVYEMCDLPDFPELLEERIQRVTIQGAAGADGTVPRSTIDAEGEGESLEWRCAGKQVTDLQRVRDLFADLAALEYGGCVSYRPSDEAVALCGLTAPTATIWANYTTATDLEEHFQMVIGALTLDGEARYVRVGTDSTIYRVPIGMLDTILVVALSGFDA